MRRQQCWFAVCVMRESLESFARLSLLIHLSEEKALDAYGMGGVPLREEMRFTGVYCEMAQPFRGRRQIPSMEPPQYVM